MDAIILSVGDELVSGQTTDTNSAYLARELALRGLSTRSHETVGDDVEDIAEAIRRAAKRAAFVFVTGGLGPTPDDLTRQALAAALRTELVPDPASLGAIEEFFRRRGREMVAANRIQAMIPSGAEALANDLGTAPGIAARIGSATVFVMPGVPHEMRGMFAARVAPRLPAGEGAIVSTAIHTFGTGESDVASRISDLMRRGSDPVVGTTVAAGLVSIRIVSRDRCGQRAWRRVEAAAGEIIARLGELVVGRDEDTMSSVVGAALAGSGGTLATAESCTGGLIAKMITDVPGSSRYFLGSVVAYADEVKRRMLDVPPELLAAHGAVSEAVAAAMAEGCRRRFASTYALGTTGIAGPSGGTDEKPVGLAYVAMAGADGTQVIRGVFPPDRDMVRLRTALTALNLLRLAMRCE